MKMERSIYAPCYPQLVLLADLHIHGRFARGTSKNLNLKALASFAKLKGLNLLAIGDIFHELWMKEAKELLKPSEDGFYELNGIYFVTAGEVHTLGGSRGVHHVVILPSIEHALEFREKIRDFGNFEDGRARINLSARDFAEKLFDFCEDAILFPAHIWTPYFGIFGSKTGYSSLTQVYGEFAGKIPAIETGLSSDPEMNWHKKELHNKAIVSFSDAHSFWPHRLGRELTAFEAEPGFTSLRKAFEKNRIAFTIEVDPAYGKYHYDGHRKCKVWLHPKQAIKLNNTCPVCGKPLTLGVLHRVLELSDTSEKPENAKPFYKILPLTEIIARVSGASPNSKSVLKKYERVVKALGSEVNILLNAEEKEIAKVLGEEVAGLIGKMRRNELKIRPGYDGVYGEIVEDIKEKRPKTLEDFFE